MVGDIFQPTHLLFVLVVALLVLGPKRLPEVAKTLGKGIRDFRGAISGDSDQPNPVASYLSGDNSPDHTAPTPTGETPAPVSEPPAPPPAAPAPSAAAPAAPAETAPTPATTAPTPATTALPAVDDPQPAALPDEPVQPIATPATTAPPEQASPARPSPPQPAAADEPATQVHPTTPSAERPE